MAGLVVLKSGAGGAMRRLLVVAAAVAACGGTGSPPIIVDSPDSGTQTDGGTDAGSDAGTPDAGPVLPPVVTGKCANVGSPSLWPNAASELDPPAGYTPPDNGSDPAFDFRYDAGAGAFAGTWVRRLQQTIIGATRLQYRMAVIVGHEYRISEHGQWMQSNGLAQAFISIRWRDSDLKQIAFPGSSGHSTLASSWAFWSYVDTAPPTAAFGDFEIVLSTATAGVAEFWTDDLLVVDCG